MSISGGSGKEAKCWLLPVVEVAANRGYTRHEIDRIERLVRDGAERLIGRWNEECGAASVWSARLSRATPAERASWRVGGAGTPVEWPSIDEHVGAWTMLGVPEDEVLEAAGFTMTHRAARA